jgi:hypothetical protein
LELRQCDVCGKVDVKENFYDYSLHVYGVDKPVDAADLCPACANWVRVSVQKLKRLKQPRAAAQ